MVTMKSRKKMIKRVKRGLSFIRRMGYTRPRSRCTHHGSCRFRCMEYHNRGECVHTNWSSTQTRSVSQRVGSTVESNRNERWTWKPPIRGNESSALQTEGTIVSEPGIEDGMLVQYWYDTDPCTDDDTPDDDDDCSTLADDVDGYVLQEDDAIVAPPGNRLVVTKWERSSSRASHLADPRPTTIAQAHLNINFQLALRDLGVPNNVQKQLVESETAVRKKQVIHQHLQLKSRDQEGSHWKGDKWIKEWNLKAASNPRPLEQLEELHGKLKTTNRKGIQVFISCGLDQVVYFLDRASVRTTHTASTASVVHAALCCVNDLAQTSLRRLALHSYAVQVVAQCVNFSLPSCESTGPSQIPRILESTKFSLAFLTKVAWLSNAGLNTVIGAIQHAAIVKRQPSWPWLDMVNALRNGVIDVRHCIALPGSTDPFLRFELRVQDLELRLEVLKFIISFISLQNTHSHKLDSFTQHIQESTLGRAIEAMLEATQISPEKLQQETPEAWGTMMEQHQLFCIEDEDPMSRIALDIHKSARALRASKADKRVCYLRAIAEEVQRQMQIYEQLARQRAEDEETVEFPPVSPARAQATVDAESHNALKTSIQQMEKQWEMEDQHRSDTRDQQPWNKGDQQLWNDDQPPQVNNRANSNLHARQPSVGVTRDLPPNALSDSEEVGGGSDMSLKHAVNESPSPAPPLEAHSHEQPPSQATQQQPSIAPTQQPPSQSQAVRQVSRTGGRRPPPPPPPKSRALSAVALSNLEKSKEEVFEFLNGLELGQYYDSFMDMGFDTINRISGMDDGDFAALNMKYAHAKSLRKGIARSQANKPAPQSLTIKTTPASPRKKDATEDKLSRMPFSIIPPRAIFVRERIGGGSFGDVHIATYHESTVVVKRIHNTHAEGKQEGGRLSIDVVLREAEAMEKCKNHPHVVSLFGVCCDGDEISLVSEFCELGSLEEVVVKSQQKITLAEVTHLVKQGVSGLVHLHTMGVIHRDIAARNFLMDARGIVKVCDFGLAAVKDAVALTPNPYGGKRKSIYEPGTQSSNVLHPLKWSAPETLRNRQYSKRSDSYMVAVFIWELWHQSQPYPNLDHFQAAIGVLENKLRPEFPAQDLCTQQGRDLAKLLNQCWLEDVRGRPYMDEIFRRVAQIASTFEDVVGSPTQMSRQWHNAQSSPQPFLLGKTLQPLLSQAPLNLASRYEDWGQEDGE